MFFLWYFKRIHVMETLPHSQPPKQNGKDMQCKNNITHILMKLHIWYMDCVLVNVPSTETRRHVPWLRIDVSSRWESSSNTTESRNIDYIRKRVWSMSHAVHAIDLFYRFRMRVDTLYPLTRLIFSPLPNFSYFPSISQRSLLRLPHHSLSFM